MTRATVEDSTTGLGQTLRTGRLLVGGLSFHDVYGLCTSSLAHRLSGGIQTQGMRDRRCRRGSLALGGRPTACDPHVLGGAQCGEQRGTDHKSTAIQVCMCTSPCAWLSSYVSVRAHVCLRACLRVHMSVCVAVCMCVCLSARVHVC